MSAIKRGQRSARRASPSVSPDDGIFAALRDTLTALRADTVPKSGHRRPREMAACWKEVFKDLETLEAAFLDQAEIAQILAAALRDPAAAKRVPLLTAQAGRLRQLALGMELPTQPRSRR